MKVVRKQLELSVRREGFATPRVTPALTIEGGLTGLAAAFYNTKVEHIELGRITVTEYDNGFQSRNYDALVTVTKCMDPPETRFADGGSAWMQYRG